VAELVRRAPRLAGHDRARWTLALLGRTVPWLRGRKPGSIRRILRRLGVAHKRGRRYVHSPDPAYDRKLAAITAAQALARANPGAVVLLYEDELTYHRRPAPAPGWAPRGADRPRAAQGWAPDKTRRVAACLEALTGRLLWWQRPRFDRRTLGRCLRDAAAAYPEAEVIYLALDNWPVHFHPEVLAALAATPIELLPLPTYAPWTNPVERVWRRLTEEVLAGHEFADDWPALQAAVEAALARFAAAPARLLRAAGLPPAACPDQ
jgi:hypothetical protein